MPPRARRRPEGIVARHASRCPACEGRDCECRPSYQAQVYSPLDRRTIRRTFGALADARAWRSEAQSQLRRGTMRAPTRTTLAEAAAEWLSGARQGVIRTRSGEPYKPSALRSYEQALRTKLLPSLGNLRLSTVTRAAVQDLVDRLLAEGRSPSTVRNAILPLRAIYRRAISRSEVMANPTLGLALPAVRSRRERIARPAEARALLAALEPEDRAAWATALYAGLRRGELKALRWQDVDLEGGLIRVERGWDDREGPIAPKSRAGRRAVPLAKPLRAQLAEHRLKARGGEEGLVFGEGPEKALSTEALAARARRAWREAGRAQTKPGRLRPVPELRRDDGVEIHWEERGSGPLLVVSVHTFAYPEVIADLIADLASDHRVVTYDARGTGRSSRSGPYDVATDRDDLEALIGELGAPAVALAWGESSYRALFLSAERPELVPAVVVMGGGGGMVMPEEAAASSEGIGGSDAVRAAFIEMLKADYRGAIRYMVSSTSPQLSDDEVRERVERGIAYCTQEAAIARFSTWDPGTEVAPVAEGLGERLWVVQFPVIWFPRETIEMVRQRLPRAHVVGLDARDGPLSQPAITAGVVRAATAAALGPAGD